MYSPVTDGNIWLNGEFFARPFANGALIGASIFGLILFIDYLNNQQKRRQLGGVAIVGDTPHLWRRLRTKPIDYRSLFQSGYDKFSKQSKPYAVWQQNDDFVIVVPPGTEEEIKNVGPDKLSFLHAVNDSYHFWLHTKILGRSHIDAVRLLVNKHMTSLHSAVVKQSDVTIPEYFDPLARDEEPVSAFLAIWHLTHVVAASFLVGPEYAKNKAYTDAIEYYCLQAPAFAHMYFWLPAPIRRIYWYFSPSGAKIRSSLKTMKTEISPEIRRNINAWRKGEHATKEPTLLRAILDVKAESGQISKKSVDHEEDERQIDIFEDELIFTGFDSAGPVVCLVLYSRGSACRWAYTIMTRSVRQPMQLKTAGNLNLRPGSIITSPAWMIHNDKDYYDRPGEFDPWRFYDEKNNKVTTKSTTTSNKFLVYGYGSGICPGRHIGIRWSQILFAKLLMRYDTEFEDALKGKPDNVVMPGQLLPPYMAKIVFKRRE
uniref:P450 n=1 Tax=Preussia typharum TaxID=718249 RepID=A0A8A0XX20_9PLEO|nr:P450 [Preussia typharum]